MSSPEIDPATLPDLLVGVPSDALPVGQCLVGRVGDQSVLVVRTQDGVRAVQATCPHYGAPLADGCVHEGRIHCPWHHASFDLTDGTLSRPPALAPLESWSVEERDGLVRVSDATPRTRPLNRPPRARGTVAVVGAGAAGTAAVLALREAGHAGPVLLIDPDPGAPYDRPNLSKDYLAGTAPEEWLPLRSSEDWTSLEVERVVDRVTEIDPDEPTLQLASGRTITFDALILATGAAPHRLPVPGADGAHVFTLRSLADSRAIRARADEGVRAVMIGAGFIGLEVAASLRHRQVEVDVVALDSVPLGAILGRELGAQIQALHERNGVRFHLETGVREIDPRHVHLDDGTSLPAELVIVGIGVKPQLSLAAQAGLEIDGGVVVDAFLESSRKGVYAVGDIASFPHPDTGRSIRIEHWAVAQAQGRTAAFNLLGHTRPFRQVPFFWTSQYDVTLQWSGFPDAWDRVEIDGSLVEGSLSAHFMRGEEALAAAFVGRDQDGLRWELARHDRITRTRK